MKVVDITGLLTENEMLLNDENFDRVINEYNIILVDFWAEWCVPCERLSPILDQIAEETGIPLGKLNVDENIKKSLEYGINSIPYMVLFKGGKPVHKIVGALPKNRLLLELSEWI